MRNEDVNKKPLRDWLTKRNARRQWDQTVRNVGVLTCYNVGQAVVLVMSYGADRDVYHGWDIFVPASLDTSIDATLEAADKALGIET